MFGNPRVAHAATVFPPGSSQRHRDQKNSAPFHAHPRRSATRGSSGCSDDDPSPLGPSPGPHGRGRHGCPRPLQKEVTPRTCGSEPRPRKTKTNACSQSWQLSHTVPFPRHLLWRSSRWSYRPGRALRKGILHGPPDHTLRVSYGHQVSV